MAASFSRPDCDLCASYREGLACGACSAHLEKTTTAVRKRRDIVRRAFVGKRGGAGGQATGSRRGTAVCANGHRWSTITVRGSDSEVEDPKCPVPECRKYLRRISFVRGEYAEEVKCADICKNAKDNECRCSCAGANHGMNLGKLKYIKEKRRR